MFLDGPIAGDVRTDFSIPPNGVVNIPIPLRVTWCYCDPDSPVSVEDGPEIAVYRPITWGPKVALMSCDDGATDELLLKRLNAWITSDLTAVRWDRGCRDRRAFT